MDEWINGRMNEWMDGRIDEWTLTLTRFLTLIPDLPHIDINKNLNTNISH